MSEYEGFAEGKNNEDADIKPYNIDAFGLSLNGCDLKNDDSEKIKYEDDIPVKRKQNKKLFRIIFVTVCVLLFVTAIVGVVLFAKYNTDETEIYDYSDVNDTYYDESVDVQNNEVAESDRIFTDIETIAITTETTKDKVPNNGMTGQTTANSSDTAMLLWPGTEWHAYELLGNDFNLDIVYVYSSSTAMYDVYDMEPAAGSVLERGSNVTVYVSLGDAQDAWSEWTEESGRYDQDIEYEYKEQYRYSRVCEIFEDVDDILVFQYAECEEWSEWIDGNVPEDISGDYWWSDEYYEYYEYAEIEYRTVCRYRTRLMTVD